MNSKVTSIVSYITVIGFVVAVVLGEKDENSKRHLNQAFVLVMIGAITAALGFVLGGIPIIGLVFKLISVLMTVAMIVGIVTAATDSDFSMPFIGEFKFIK